MEKEETLRETEALQHNLYINSSLRLEFLASLSKLLHDYGIEADDLLLSSLIIAVPEELSAQGDEPLPPLSPDEPLPPLAPEEEEEEEEEEPLPPLAPEGEPLPPAAP